MPARLWALALTCLLTAATSLARPAEITWEPWSLEAYDGQTLEGELGRLAVPLRRDTDSEEAMLELAFARLPGREGASSPPIVYLDGGPGSSPLRAARIPEYRDLFEALRAAGDVILLDQRGVGLSSPGLSCPRAEGPPPLDPFLFTPAQRLERLDELEGCATRLRAAGVDLAAFDTAASADDLESLRQALGVEAISILGFSYGTHLGTSFLRRHPDGVARAALVGVEGPDHTRKLPSSLDAALAKVSLLAARDPDAGTRDLLGLTRRVLDRLDREPARIPARLDGREVEIPLSGQGLRFILQIDLGDASDLPYYPALIRSIEAGDYRLLAWWVRKRAGALIGGVRALYWLVDGASGASPERWDRIEREERDAIFGPIVRGLFPEATARFGIDPLPESFRQRLVSDVPTLFVSGTLDANSPPYQAEEVRWGFPRSEHLVIQNAGHEQMLTHPSVVALLTRFFTGEDVRPEPLALPPVDFLGLEEALAGRGVELPLDLDPD